METPHGHHQARPQQVGALASGQAAWALPCVGLLVWLLALRAVLGIRSGGSLCRTVVVKGTPPALRAALIRLISTSNSSALDAELDGADRVTMRRRKEPTYNSTPAFASCTATVTAMDANRSRLDFTADLSRIQSKTWLAARWLLLASLGILGTICLLLWQASVGTGNMSGLSGALALAFLATISTAWIFRSIHVVACRQTGIYLDSLAANASLLAEVQSDRVR